VCWPGSLSRPTTRKARPLAEVISIPVDLVHVPEDYLRPVDHVAAQALAKLLAEEGQKTPVAVYRSMARRDGKHYTLIYGARRLEAAKLLRWTEIDAILHNQSDARILAIRDNLALSTLNALEEAEYLIAYREWWEDQNGQIQRGRLKKGQNDPLTRDFNFLEKSGFFNHLEEKFRISKKTAQRRLAIGRLIEPLRNALRGTSHAADRQALGKLARMPSPQQQGIVVALNVDPDLAAILRMDDPATGRKGSGRMETGDWREQQFIEAWEAMPRDRRAAALEKIGAVAKPLDPWPTHWPAPEPLPSPGNASPLWHMMRDPYRTLHTLPTYSDILAARQERAEEEQEQERHEKLETWEKINATERETRPDYERTVAKGKAVKKRKSKPGRKPDSPHVKREKAFKKLFIPELVTNLLQHEELGITHWAVKYCRELDAKEQFWVACHLANDHRIEDIPWRVERNREEEALSLQSEIDFEAASKPVGSI